MQVDFRSGTVRAVTVFIIVFAVFKLLFYLLDRAFGFNLPAETLLILIGAGWTAYWVWKKTEVGRY